MNAAPWADRLRRALPALWLGGLLTVGLLVAPASFAQLSRADAGRLNAVLFTREGWAGIALALVLWLLERARARRRAAAGQGSVLSTEMVLLMAVLLASLLSLFGVQPLMLAARSGAAGAIGFGALHAASVLLYAVKLLLIAALAWRAAAPPSTAAPAPPGP
ncbi:MAG: DUF4149 domain-containing protein [Rubrivivax sp.]